MSLVDITLQDYDSGEEHTLQVPLEDYDKIISGDDELATRYLQREIERKNRLLAYQISLKKNLEDVSLKRKEKRNLFQLSSRQSVEDNSDTNNVSAQVSDQEVEVNDTNPSQRWSDRETKQLIELFRENFEKLHDRKYRAKSIYMEIAKHFERFNCDQIESKIKNLKKTYKIILDNSNKTGRGRITWPYFDSMQEILGNKPENNPLSIASNRAGFKKIAKENSVPNSDSDSETPLPKMCRYSKEMQSVAGPSGLNSNTTNKKKQGNAKVQTSEPEWVKEFRSELSQHHRERLEKQQQFLDLFREWISKSKD